MHEVWQSIPTDNGSEVARGPSCIVRIRSSSHARSSAGHGTMRILNAATVALLSTLPGTLTSQAQKPASATATTPSAKTAGASAKTTIVLVHGAFADATG